MHGDKLVEPGHGESLDKNPPPLLSDFDVPGTATVKQDGRTDYWDGWTSIWVAGQRCLSIKDASGAQESIKEYELSRTPT